MTSIFTYQSYHTCKQAACSVLVYVRQRRAAPCQIMEEKTSEKCTKAYTRTQSEERMTSDRHTSPTGSTTTSFVTDSTGTGSQNSYALSVRLLVSRNLSASTGQQCNSSYTDSTSLYIICERYALALAN
eukprot:scpid27326/ scgid6400/ 